VEVEGESWWEMGVEGGWVLGGIVMPGELFIVGGGGCEGGPLIEGGWREMGARGGGGRVLGKDSGGLVVEGPFMGGGGGVVVLGELFTGGGGGGEPGVLRDRGFEGGSVLGVGGGGGETEVLGETTFEGG
jgi:hypothetical protein